MLFTAYPCQETVSHLDYTVDHLFQPCLRCLRKPLHYWRSVGLHEPGQEITFVSVSSLDSSVENQ